MEWLRSRFAIYQLNLVIKSTFIIVRLSLRHRKPRIEHHRSSPVHLQAMLLSSITSRRSALACGFSLASPANLSITLNVLKLSLSRLGSTAELCIHSKPSSCVEKAADHSFTSSTSSGKIGAGGNRGVRYEGDKAQVI